MKRDSYLAWSRVSYHPIVIFNVDIEVILIDLNKLEKLKLHYGDSVFEQPIIVQVY